MIRFLWPFNHIAAFNKAKRERDREAIKQKYQSLPPEHKIPDSIFPDRMNAEMALSTETRLVEKVDAYERGVEQFLTLSSSGGLVLIATIYQGSSEKVGSYSLYSACAFAAAFLSIALLKIFQIQASYFRMGEWQKNHIDYLNRAIGNGELIWRTREAHRMSNWFILTALASLGSVCVGIVLLVIALYFGSQSAHPAPLAGLNQAVGARVN